MSPTLTPVIYPFTLEIVIYNSAGEKVRTIEDNIVSNFLSGAAVYGQDGKPITAFDPSSGSAELKLTGANLPGGTAGISYYWDGSNDQGQPLNSGDYFISVKVTDEYGAAQTHSVELKIIRSEKYILLSIYNSSGEIVRRFEVEPQAGELAGLAAPEVSYVGGSGQAVNIQYAPGKFINWDGTGIDGVLVSGGVYEIKLQQQFEDGYHTMSAKSITVLTERTMEIVSEIKAVPNPVIAGNGAADRVEFTWSSPYSGRMEFRIYNTAGELISKFRAGLAFGYSRWDMKSPGGKEVSSGIYSVVCDAITDTGEHQRLFIKSVVIRVGSNDF